MQVRIQWTSTQIHAQWRVNRRLDVLPSVNCVHYALQQKFIIEILFSSHPHYYYYQRGYWLLHEFNWNSALINYLLLKFRFHVRPIFSTVCNSPTERHIIRFNQRTNILLFFCAAIRFDSTNTQLYSIKKLCQETFARIKFNSSSTVSHRIGSKWVIDYKLRSKIIFSFLLLSRAQTANCENFEWKLQTENSSKRCRWKIRNFLLLLLDGPFSSLM